MLILGFSLHPHIGHPVAFRTRSPQNKPVVPLPPPARPHRQTHLCQKERHGQVVEIEVLPILGGEQGLRVTAGDPSNRGDRRPPDHLGWERRQVQVAAAVAVVEQTRQDVHLARRTNEDGPPGGGGAPRSFSFRPNPDR